MLLPCISESGGICWDLMYLSQNTMILYMLCGKWQKYHKPISSCWMTLFKLWEKHLLCKTYQIFKGKNFSSMKQLPQIYFLRYYRKEWWSILCVTLVGPRCPDIYLVNIILDVSVSWLRATLKKMGLSKAEYHVGELHPVSWRSY